MNRVAKIVQRASAASAYGNACAQARLGYAYQHAQGGLAKDYAMALAWYEKAAEQGHQVAMNNLGTLYALGGHGVPKDEATAASWFDKASEATFAGQQPRTGLAPPMDFPGAEYNDPASWADHFADASNLEMAA
jgi:TPR repeat protein